MGVHDDGLEAFNHATEALAVRQQLAEIAELRRAGQLDELAREPR